MTDILRQLRAHYDLILLDAPAFFDTATAASMASMVDGVLLVNKSDKVADLIKKQLDAVGANLIATITIQQGKHAAPPFRSEAASVLESA